MSASAIARVEGDAAFRGARRRSRVARALACYAIRDGHHRVSVARARGAQFIDAHIAGPSTADAIRTLTSAVRRWLPRPLDERAWTDAFKQLDALLASQAA